MANMVMTILEAHVAPEQWSALEQTYQQARGDLPSQMVATFLVHSVAEPLVWRGISVWHSREALDEYRRSAAVPGVQVFRAVGAEPKELFAAMVKVLRRKDDPLHAAAAQVIFQVGPDAIGEVVVFLGSDAARYVNGVNLPVDGRASQALTSLIPTIGPGGEHLASPLAALLRGSSG